MATAQAIQAELSSGKVGLYGTSGAGAKHTAIEVAGSFYKAEEYHQKWNEKRMQGR